MSYSLIYITTKDQNEAEKIGKELVEERLVACVNIYPSIKSIYWWDGKIADESESVLIAKTRTSLADRVISRIKKVHSYSCPCIVALPIENGNPEFLKWIEKETAEPTS